MENLQEIKVQTKEWSNPTPAGLVALAVACFCFFALLNGFVGHDALPIIGCWLIGGFVIQVVVGLLDLKGGNNTGGNTFLFFSAFFMLATGMGMFFKYFAGAGEISPVIDGYAWLCLSIVLILWTPAFLKPFGILSLLVLTLCVALPFISLLDLGVLGAEFKVVPAYALLIAGLFGIYLSSAMVVNKAYGREVYPLFLKK